MQFKAILTTALLASLTTAHGPDGDEAPHTSAAPRLAARADHTVTTTATTSTSYSPEQMSKYHADMRSLHSRVRNDPLYTSMRGVLKTAVPETYRDALKTNPSSVHKALETSPPDWYKHLPKDIKHFMEVNQKAAKSVWNEDLGPTPSGGKKAKSEAGKLNLVGATVGALVGAVGVAVLLL
ncbi:hypothetical protein BT63DRAFT_428639 [Microthyrium microscopicum]|uniref:ASX DEUBAD domain-containing protein n=1 Tax=Microthyrium microscopicum TaxID=703497 RepID=A0A6A6U267_9PEZI|nr:hypothetical protein BT63DRAFT_428639 [Microthyrium microscopicum]